MFGRMNQPKVVIIDYGLGNLLSVQRAVEACGLEAILSSEPDIMARADHLLLPGVGAFANGMQALESLGLVEVIKGLAADGIPLLGICLGMQLLFDQSEEYGTTKGLGIIPGRVVPVPVLDLEGNDLKIPHIGWNSLTPSTNATWNGTILQNTPAGDSVYFVHSFVPEPYDPATRIADCLYGGNRILAAIGSRNISGCQFHPEKSGKTGIKILKTFLGSSD